VRAAIVLGCLAAIFGAQLLLSIVVSSGQYEIAALQSQQTELDRTADALQESLQTLSSSQNLVQQAAGLGMVQGTDAAYLRLSDGAVIPAANPTDRYPCVGVCDLVANELVAAIPQVHPTQGTTVGTTTQQPVTQQPGTQQVAQGPATDTIPAPVTR
jgi:Na+-transporting NADH:ubiquinone oxidoreductase subunit NqrC